MQKIRSVLQTCELIPLINLDHITISGMTLSEASDYVESSLGVNLQDGGSHQRYGTHNRLLRLEEGVYLEVIAIDPKKKKPPYPRWFNLDNFVGKPRITNWVCSSQNIEDAFGSFFFEGLEIVKMRRNQLKWLMALPKNGVLPFDGAHPLLLEWKTTPPALRLLPSGCYLKQITIFHPDYVKLREKLKNFNDHRVSFAFNDGVKFHMEISTPNGVRSME